MARGRVTPSLMKNHLLVLGWTPSTHCSGLARPPERGRAQGTDNQPALLSAIGDIALFLAGASVSPGLDR